MSDETSETEDQKQAEIVEETGVTGEKERRLTLEAEKLIRQFMIRWVSLPAVFLAVISFALGFFIEKVAFQTASNQAFQSAQSDVMKLIEKVMDAKHKADAAAGAIQTSSEEIGKTEEKAKKFAEELTSLRSKLDSTVAFQASDPQIKNIADVLARDPRITKVLDDLDNSIQARLKRADEEIEKMKAAYRIDCQEEKAGKRITHGLVFTFPFPVKHAWIELGGIDPEDSLTVKNLKDNNVTVVEKSRIPYPSPESKKSLRRHLEHHAPPAFRIWATSF